MKAQKKPSIEFHISGMLRIDLIVSLYMIQKIIESYYADSPLPSYASCQTVLNYVNDIEAGKQKIITSCTLYAFFSKIGINQKKKKKRAKQIVHTGLQLFDLVFEALEKKGSIDLFHSTLDTYLEGKERKLKDFDKLPSLIDKQIKCYEDDKNKGAVVTRSVDLWNQKDNRIDRRNAAIWVKRPGTEDEYLNAREENVLLTVYPYSIKGQKNPNNNNEKDQDTQVVISINPDATINEDPSLSPEDYSLLPMAEVLEQFEQIEEDRLYRVTGQYRRDHSQPRNTQGIFAEIPFSETSDPWSISEKKDIVFNPSAGSLLEYDIILSVIKNSIGNHGDPDNPNSSYIAKVKKTCFSGNSQGISSKDEEKSCSFGQLYTETRQAIQTLTDKSDTLENYLFYSVKVNPAILKYNNDFIKSCCLKMVGKSDSYSSPNNLMFIDYRTCLYCDSSITIVVKADLNFLNIEEPESKETSDPLRNDLEKLLKQRIAFREIAAELPAILEKTDKDKQASKVGDLNKKLVQLNAEIEKQDILISDPVEQEVYDFIKKMLGIQSLKETVTASAELLIENINQQREKEAKELRLQREEREKKENEKEMKRDNQLQSIMGLLAMLGIISAFCDLFGFMGSIIPGGIWNRLEGFYRSITIIVIVIITAVAILAIWFSCKAISFSRKNNKKEG